MFRMSFLLLPAAVAAFAADNVPRANVSNGVLELRIDLPDAVRGYYRGTRFDWSGQISSLRFRGHDFFGQWNEKVDPQLHDSIMGPVEDFRSQDGGLGYAEAQAGGKFVRIGVGVLRKPEEAAFQPFRTYDILDHGKWSVRQAAGSIEFTHELSSDTGYGYVYRKTLRLEPGKPRLSIEHTLRNTGTKTIETQQYNHNFFVMDGKPTGPDAKVIFAFEPKALMDLKGMAEVRGRELAYRKELERGESVFSHLAGFGATAGDYDLRLEHRQAGIGVHITGDRPIAKFVYWSIRSTFCPEPYIDLKAAPGAETSWRYTYEFYELKK
jgi:hypothetical protein